MCRCTCHAFPSSHQVSKPPGPQGLSGSMAVPPPQQEKLALWIPAEGAAVGTGEGGDTSSQELQAGEMLGKGLSKTNLKM